MKLLRSRKVLSDRAVAWLTPTQKEEIVAAAAVLGLSLAEYARRAFTQRKRRRLSNEVAPRTRVWDPADQRTARIELRVASRTEWEESAAREGLHLSECLRIALLEYEAIRAAREKRARAKRLREDPAEIERQRRQEGFDRRNGRVPRRRGRPRKRS